MFSGPCTRNLTISKDLFDSIIIFFYLNVSYLFTTLHQEEILKEIRNYLKNENINYPLQINKKIKIPDCNGHIKIKNKYKNYKTLEINCLGKQPWSYNLRTNLKIKVNEKNKKRTTKKKKIGIFISNKKFKRGDIIKKEDIALKYFTQVGSSNSYSKAGQLIGKKIKLPVNKGQIIRERHLMKNWLIKEGQKASSFLLGTIDRLATADIMTNSKARLFPHDSVANAGKLGGSDPFRSVKKL